MARHRRRNSMQAIIKTCRKKLLAERASWTMVIAQNKAAKRLPSLTIQIDDITFVENETQSTRGVTAFQVTLSFTISTRHVFLVQSRSKGHFSGTAFTRASQSLPSPSQRSTWGAFHRRSYYYLTIEPASSVAFSITIIEGVHHLHAHR